VDETIKKTGKTAVGTLSVRACQKSFCPWGEAPARDYRFGVVGGLALMVNSPNGARTLRCTQSVRCLGVMTAHQRWYLYFLMLPRPGSRKPDPLAPTRPAAISARTPPHPSRHRAPPSRCRF